MTNVDPGDPPSSRLLARLAREQRAWVENLEATAAWSREHGRTPSFREPHGGWLRRQRASSGAGTLDAERRALLDERLPGWQFAVTGRRPDEGAWDASLARVVATFEQGGRLPTSRESGGRWLRTQRDHAASGSLDKRREELLDARLPGWRLAGRARS